MTPPAHRRAHPIVHHADCLVLAAALLLPNGPARADGSLITTSVQVSLKIQQSCQIDSTDGASAAIASSADAVAAAPGIASAAAATVARSAAASSGTVVASTGQTSDGAPKVSCQFDEPYGVLSSAAIDPTAKTAGAALRPGDTTQLASFWTVLF